MRYSEVCSLSAANHLQAFALFIPGKLLATTTPARACPTQRSLHTGNHVIEAGYNDSEARRGAATLHNLRQVNYKAAAGFDQPQRLRGPALISGVIYISTLNKNKTIAITKIITTAIIATAINRKNENRNQSNAS
jgi:hypothetical protein